MPAMRAQSPRFATARVGRWLTCQLVGDAAMAGDLGAVAGAPTAIMDSVFMPLMRACEALVRALPARDRSRSIELATTLRSLVATHKASAEFVGCG